MTCLAGADIAEMANRTFADNYKENFLADWNSIFKTFPKPVIAAVNGFAVIISNYCFIISLKARRGM